MSRDLPLSTDFDPVPETVVQVSPLVRRVVAANPGPFTFRGTNTYIVGDGTVAVIDPGPALPAHLDAILSAVATETVSHIAITHTHRDHSPGARRLRDETGAPIVGCAPHRRSRPLGTGENDTMEGAGDADHRPDREMAEGDRVAGPGWSLEALATPGHTANHLAFRLAEENALFSGDHVMGWSTTIVAPPDGSMTAFMASLDKLRGRDETIYWPGHGGEVRDPQRLVRALIHHRRQREASILTRVAAGDRTAAAIVGAIYQDIAPALVGAARLSVYAHLEDLVERGLIRTDGPPLVDGEYRPA